MAEVHEPIEAVQRPERVSSAAQQERITSASSYRSNAGAAATTEAVPVQERGGTLYADDVDLSRSATDDEKASVGHRTPVSDNGRKNSVLDSLPSPTRRVSQGQLEVIVETGGSSLNRGLRRVRQVPEDLLKDTIETDNKRRPAVQRENRVRYGLDQQTYYPDDSQSVAKSVALKKVKANLEDWEKQIVQIEGSKLRSDKLLKHEVLKRDSKIAGLQATSEQQRSEIAELTRHNNSISNQLAETSKQLATRESQVQTLSQQLQEYQGAYQAAEEDKQGLTQQLTEVGEELERSENVRKRLNEDVTELQVQLDLERQRSKSCTIL